MPTLTSSEVQAALATLISNGLNFSTCIHAFEGTTADEQAYISAAVANAGGGTDIEPVVSLSDDGGAYVMAWVWVDDKDIWEGKTDSDGEPCRTRSHYNHCNAEWEDDWSSECNDKCGVCGKEIEPYESDDLDLEGNVIPRTGG